MFPNSSDGWAAEARFWALNNIIAEAANCKLDLSLKRNQATVADELGLNLSDFQNFISILKCKDLELIFEIEPEIFSTQKVQDAFNITNDKRTKAKERKKITSPEVVEKNAKFAELSQSSPELLDKVKESKVNESKVNENKVKVNEIENIISPQTSPINPQTSLPFTFNSFFYDSYDFTLTNVFKNSIALIFKQILSIDLSQSEITRLHNILSHGSLLPMKSKAMLMLDLCNNYHSLPPNKQNLPYFCSSLIGKIADSAILAREKISATEKQKENNETIRFLLDKNKKDFYSDKENDGSVREIINSLSHSKGVFS